jgi:hypothetical protein
VERFVQDRLPEPRLDGVTDDEIHASSEQSLQEGLQLHVGVERLDVELDDEVEVTPFPGRAPGAGAKETETANAVLTNGRRILRPSAGSGATPAGSRSRLSRAMRRPSMPSFATWR